MIVITAKLQVKDGKEEAMKDAMKEAAEKVAANEPGNLAYIPHQSQGDPTIFLFYEKYKDKEALELHRQQDHYKEVAGKMGGILAGKPQIDFYTEL
jgi:quinol monooxygenase YgiN